MLQYWEGAEERIFKVEGGMRDVPKASISLLSADLIVKVGNPQQSVFGAKYPIVISGGPAFKSALVLATSSTAQREEWVAAFNSAIEALKERQRVSMLERKIITDPADPQYSSVDNQYRMLEDKQAKIRVLDENMKRKLMHMDVLKQRDNSLYKTQEDLQRTYMNLDAKLYSLTAEDSFFERRFKFINKTFKEYVAEDRPYGMWKNKQKVFDNYPANEFKDSEKKIYNPAFSKHHTYHTDNVYDDHNIDKEFNRPKITTKDKGGKVHDIRKLAELENDPDMWSFAQMNCFEILKKGTAADYNLVKDCIHEVRGLESHGAGHDEVAHDISSGGSLEAQEERMKEFHIRTKIVAEEVEYDEKYRTPYGKRF